jgi:putative DNA primase/helicase
MSTLASQPSARPIAPPPRFENIPQELRERLQWVVWRYELRRDTWTKVPYIPFDVRKASTTAPGTWRSFRAARACYEDRPDYFDGIGYIFSADDPYVGVDFDHCLDQAGQLGDFAAAHLPATYAEVSASGDGVKFIVRAKNLPSGRHTAQAESTRAPVCSA